MPDRRSAWEARYRSAKTADKAARVLTENAHLLPETGTALDLACGTAVNGCVLARHGLQTRAWDYAPAAIEGARRRAAGAGVHLDCAVRDVVAEPPPAASFDVIVVARFLDRTLAPALAAALRPGGLLFYQTFTCWRSRERPGPGNPAFLLRPGELWRLFPDLEPLVYREERHVGATRQGWRDEALLVALKPPADTPTMDL